MAPLDQRDLQVISQIAEGLSSSERQRLFYLCESLDMDHSMASAKEMLRTKVVCHESGDLFLAELLSELRRFDILSKVCRTNRAEVERALKYRQILPRFRVLMAHLSEDMDDEDLSRVKFLISHSLPREKRENAKNFLDVVIELEKLDLVSPENVDFVEKCLTNVGRVDLAKKVASYKMAAMPVAAQRQPKQESCSPLCPRPTPHSCPPVQQTSQHPLLHVEKQSIRSPIDRGPSCQSLLDRYRFTSNPRGVCVIIDCVGNDGDKLEQTFKALHFNVALHKWLSVEDTLSVLSDVSRQRENLKADGLVCCIISRATENRLLGVDSFSAGLHLDGVRRLFTSNACPMLAGKPKLFFIQTYTVPEFQPCARIEHQDEDLETDGCHGPARYECIPTDADVFWSHCWTDEGQLERGHHHSIYLKALTEALVKGQMRKNKLVDIHTEVNGAIFKHNERNSGENYHLDLKHTLRKDLYLQ